MQKQFDVCNRCNIELIEDDLRVLYKGDKMIYCMNCWDDFNCRPKPPLELMPKEVGNDYNEPAHYHQYEIDTIEFLQKGFPPEVFKGFALGSLIKYAHRHELKGGREDLVKCVDFAKRLLDWHDKTHS